MNVKGHPAAEKAGIQKEGGRGLDEPTCCASSLSDRERCITHEFTGTEEELFEHWVKTRGLEKAIWSVECHQKHQREYPNAYSPNQYKAFSESNFNLEAAIASNSKISESDIPE